MSTGRLFLLLGIACAAVPALVAQDDARDRLTLGLYLEWERVADPQISPDGQQIVYTRMYVDKVNDRWDPSLWIMNADGSRNRFLTEGSSPRWSPDGTRIAFTRQGDPTGSQLFVRWMDAEGATSQITHVEESPSNIEWSPNGESIAFVMNVPSNETWRIRLPGRPEGAKWTGDPKIVTRLGYRRDRVGYIDDGYRHIFVVPASGGTPRQLTDGDWNHSGPTWTPDGGAILFSSLRVEDAVHVWRESEIYAVSVASGTIRQLTTRRGPDGSPVVSPNGQLVAYTGNDWSDDTYETSKLYVMGIDGSNPREILDDLDRSPGSLIWSPDNRGVYFATQDRGTSNMYYAPLDGDVRPITQGAHLFNLASMTNTGVVVGTRSSIHEPGDVVTFTLRRPAAMTELTHVNDDVLAGRTLGEVEEIWYTSRDDYRIQGWIVKPPDFDPAKKYPMMLAIHGGPHGMYGVGFNFGWQEHAANGYVVLYTNPRGSSGYGSAFGNAIKRAYPGKDFDDLMAGVDTVVGRGYIDQDKLYVYGCSGGGVLTSWTVGHTDRFAAASANCPVTNWLSFVGTTDGPGWYRNFDSLPWNDPSEHLRRSPLMYVGNVTTPTMLMTGENDLRTPMPQTEEFYSALAYRGIPTAMVRFKNEWHGTGSRPSNFMRTQLYLRSWFERHTKRAPNVSMNP
ncbi:MAG TPA: S9 family peptidase [Gemmatimonadales bacterium]